MTTKIILIHQDASKWVRVAKAIKDCFANFRASNFAEASMKEFGKLNVLQDTWLGDD
jgi:hypothetical protein